MRLTLQCVVGHFVARVAGGGDVAPGGVACGVIHRAPAAATSLAFSRADAQVSCRRVHVARERRVPCITSMLAGQLYTTHSMALPSFPGSRKLTVAGRGGRSTGANFVRVHANLAVDGRGSCFIAAMHVHAAMQTARTQR